MGVLYIMDTVGCGQFPFQFRFLCVFLPHGRIAHEKLKLTGGRAGVRSSSSSVRRTERRSYSTNLIHPVWVVLRRVLHPVHEWTLYTVH